METRTGSTTDVTFVALKPSLVEWKLPKVGRGMFDLGPTLKPSLVEWKLDVDHRLAVPIFPLKPSLVEWKRVADLEV